MTQVIDITPPEQANKFIQEVEQSVPKFNIAKIKNNEGRIQAVTYAQEIKGRLKDLETLRKSLTRPIDEAKARIMDLFRRPESLLKDAEIKIKTAVLAFDNEQEAIRREQERKLQEEARKREETERKKLEEKAAKAEAKGNEGKAAELRQQAQEISIPVPTVQPIVQKAEGEQTRTIWKARILDYSKIPQQMLWATDKQKEATESYLNQVARSTKNTLPVPGVEFYEEKQMALFSR